MSKYSVGIVGVGCVGSSVLKYYQKHPDAKDIDAVGYDKFKEPFNTEEQFQKLLKQEVLFMCLPTLYSHKQQQYDKTAIHDVCTKLNTAEYPGLVVIKSTVEPGTTELLSEKYTNLDIAHNAEFLTARTAEEDFINQSHVVIGKTDSCDEEKFNGLEKLMRMCWPDAKYSICTATESETMKSFCNCFYAQKISIFNEYYLACQHIGVDYQNVLKMMFKNDWINPMHTNVPGPDGQMGYGGLCFLKDTAALYQFLKRENVPHAMIEASINENQKVRFGKRGD